MHYMFAERADHQHIPEFHAAVMCKGMHIGIGIQRVAYHYSIATLHDVGHEGSVEKRSEKVIVSDQMNVFSRRIVY